MLEWTGSHCVLWKDYALRHRRKEIMTKSSKHVPSVHKTGDHIPLMSPKLRKHNSSNKKSQEAPAPTFTLHDDVIKWKHFPRYWPFVRGIHRGPVNSPHKGQWRGALMFSLICAWINGWVNNRGAGDLRRHQAHCDVIVMTNGSALV